jgi:hypothetical protein
MKNLIFKPLSRNWHPEIKSLRKNGNPELKNVIKIGNPDCRPLPEPEQEARAGAGDRADPHPGGQLVQEPAPARQSGSRQEQVINTMDEWNV